MEFTLNPDGSLEPSGKAEKPEQKTGNAGGEPEPETPRQGPEPVIGGAPPGPGDLIKESGTANFAADVVDASAKVPVIVDFWAPWCEPCKQLGPALEKLVREANGLVRLVKINVDENQELAAQMRIQSIPAVYAFKGGQLADAFTGAVPESQLKAFIGKLTGNAKSPVDAALVEAKAALDAGDAETAGAIFGQVQAQDPTNEHALAGMIRVALAAGKSDEAKEMADSLPPELAKKSEIAAAISAVELSQEGKESGDVADLRGKLEKNENDHQARFDLAMALYAEGQNDAAIDELLELFSRDNKWNDEAARKQLVKIFDALGPADPLTVEGRKKLSSMLFS
jgi:putative thioredoxin